MQLPLCEDKLRNFIFHHVHEWSKEYIAFKFGVSEMNGWYDWEEVEAGYVFRFDEYYIGGRR